ncbi:DUF3182 family protein [Dyella sp. BiH032]|uniref:DUF3182 family protein n=1 Tax=Dyella sp. BiH032 TaxID=3075430 RepID=UPI002893305F|nr:DUF3182 family protein [Dyella sp. BiH032]WNL44117.1 DUF3182 family protein [Dyella sp. BiH032]
MAEISLRSRDARRVLVYAPMGQPLGGHELASHLWVAERLAGLLGMSYGGIGRDTERHPRGERYVVPYRTLNLREARRFGIESPADLFGGVVTEDFVGTKLITHGLVRPGAVAPSGWSDLFASKIIDVVLPGFSVFTPSDLRTATGQLLREGGVRIKSPRDMGGQGQRVVKTVDELEPLIESMGPGPWLEDGLVVERNLDEVATISVGQVVLDGIQATYVGRQRLIRNHDGDMVYGGTDLLCTRGDFEALRQLPLTGDQRLAVEQARCYHDEAIRCFPGTYASRANYDVAQGKDANGRWYSGVLEQSWRIGGASAAEVEAVGSLLAHPSRRAVWASTRESYDRREPVPDDAKIVFHGDDPKAGFLVKYVRTKRSAGT